MRRVLLYLKLSNADIAKLLELLIKLSKSPKINSLNQSIHSQALRNARLCYDHIAGKLGVKLTEVGKVYLYRNFYIKY